MAFLFDQFPRSLDAFQRYRVSSPETLFNSKQLTDGQPLYWDDQQVSGAGTSSTYNTNQASTTLSVAPATAGTRVRQTFRSFNYQSGKSQLIYMTGVLGAGAAGVRRRLGYFNQNNGLFFELNGTTLAVVRRTFTSGVAVDAVVAQSAWNIDKLDGSGPSGGNPSGITLDPSNGQLFVIDFQWLGIGQVRFGFFLSGILTYCHQLEFGNLSTVVYMGIPNLPIRYEISNDGTGPAASLVHICVSVVSEGGQEPGTSLAASRGDTPLVTLNDNGIYPLVAMRLGSSSLSADAVPTGATVACISNATYRWMILLNPTVAGVAFAFSPVANSAVEIDAARLNTTKVTGGTQIATGYGVATASSDGSVNIATSADLRLGSSIAGVSDIIVLAVQRMTVGGAAETFYGSLSWSESR